MAPAHSTNALSLLHAASRLPMAAQMAVQVAVLITTWDLRYRTRKSLRHLQAHQLNDIGLTREQAKTEAARAFWRM